MRRLLSVLLVLVITLGCLSCPVSAAEPSRSGPFSEDASPVLCDTGRGSIVYSFYASAVYYSEDGVTWTDLSDRQWVQDARPYIALTSPMVHREFQFVWTGTEYMMRQDLRDDPRRTHQRYGDSPRNSVVTFLDEDFQIIGQRAFDGPVSDIRYEDGTYYATVDGDEIAFARAEWEAGAEEAVTFSDVPADAWYAQGVALCAEKGIMVGTGDGAFSPDETLSRNQCLTLALRLYDLLHGGDGALAPAPEDWGRPTLTLTLADGTELTGHGNETVALPGVEGGRFRFGWWGWGMMGVVTRDNLHVTLEPDLEKDFDDPEYQAVQEMLGQWGDALEGPATVTVGDRVISGTVNCWIPVGDWGLSFYPDGEDTTEATQFLRSAIYSDAPADNAWWRDGAWYLSQSEELREKSNFLSFLDKDCDASRWDFAQTLYGAVGELPTLRTVDVPDLERGYRFPVAAVYHLYAAGILTGVDPYGTFDGESTLTRAQAAVMVARVLDESLRVSEPLAPLPNDGYTLTDLGEAPAGAVYYGYRWVSEDFAAFCTDEGQGPAWTLVTKDGRRPALDGAPYHWGDGLLVLDRGGQAQRFGVMDLETLEMVVPFGPYQRCSIEEDGLHQSGFYILTDDPATDFLSSLVWDREGRATPLTHTDLEWQISFACGLRREWSFEDGLYGYVDPSYQFVIPPQWARAERFRDGYAAVAVADGEEPVWGVIDAQGNQVVPPRYQELENLGQGVFLTWEPDSDEESRPGLLFAGTQGQPQLPLSQTASLSFQNGYGVYEPEVGAGAYYMDLAGQQASQVFDWAGPVDADGSALVGLSGHIYRLEFRR